MIKYDDNTLQTLLSAYYRGTYELIDVPEQLPILPLRKGILLPGVVVSVDITRYNSVQLVHKAYATNKLIGVVPQVKEYDQTPTIENVFEYGTLAKIVSFNMFKEYRASAVIWGLKRFKIVEQISAEDYLIAKVKYRKETNLKSKKINFQEELALMKSMSEYLDYKFEVGLLDEINNKYGPLAVIKLIANHLDLDKEWQYKLLKETDFVKFIEILHKAINQFLQKEQIQMELQEKIKQNIENQHREYILHQQLKVIQDELSKLGQKNIAGNKEIEQLIQKAEKKQFPQNVREVLDKEIARLKHIPPVSPEYSIQITYLNTLLELPWTEKTKDIYDINRAKKILDQDHYGLEKVKDRILEYLAVLKLNKGNLKSPILCFYGPPGVGKTSLGRSIAKALNRKFVKMSLGGLHDEAEIRGHRKTYIGAMPGRIIQNIKRAKVKNPVFVLDEIDKVGYSHRGDPASALLEVLDPEQNYAFYDNYLEVEYDLSDVLFIATANTLSTIHPALLDRMEVIEMTGYLLEEKIEIAKRHLIPKQKKIHGLNRRKINFDNNSLEFLIEKYTRESGVRELEKKIAALIRKTAKDIVLKKQIPKIIDSERITKYLGAPKFIKYEYEVPKVAGVVPGLAWTPTGGEILFIEANISRGNGKLSMTGNLGDIMKESAQIAFRYIKANYKKLKINPLLFDYWDIHLHVPQGAIPKDGPSAGITIATALASLITQRQVKPYLAMTGELTLTGKVLPVGGIKEKILAAKRAGITQIIISQKNKPDIYEIKEKYRKDITFFFVNDMEQVIDLALMQNKVKNPKKIGIPKIALKKCK